MFIYDIFRSMRIAIKINRVNESFFFFLNKFLFVLPLIPTLEYISKIVCSSMIQTRENNTRRFIG